jgi:serine protease inhibitor
MTNANKNLTFSVKLLPLLEGKDNAVICPYGIEAVLAMVAEGACEEALEQILYVLGFKNLEELREVVLAVQDVRCSAFTSDNSLELKKGEEKLELLSNFRQVMEERYNASISEDSSDGKAILSLKNIANFKAEWFHKMGRDTSHVHKFQNIDGSISHPAFLSAQNDFLRFYQVRMSLEGPKTTKAVALPYKLHGERIPYELVLVECEDELNEETLQNILDNMCFDEYKVVFPEFSIKSKYDLVPVMQCLGLNAIFNENFPGFDKIATQPLYADKFIQEAEIEVDKEGTVAKAVTEMFCECFSGISDYRDDLVFDKPFHYFLRNTTTGEIIFMGKVNYLEDCERSKSEFQLFPFGKIHL